MILESFEASLVAVKGCQGGQDFGCCSEQANGGGCYSQQIYERLIATIIIL